MKKTKNKTLVSNTKQQQKYQISELIHEVSKTGDTKTNDFDLASDKKPALSTIRRQLKNAINLQEFANTSPIRIEFDRFRMGVNINLYSATIKFKDLNLEVVSNPKEPPSYIEDDEKKWELVHNALKSIDEINSKDVETDDNPFDDSYLDNDDTNFIDSEYDLISELTVKKRIRYSDYSATIGLNNIFIDNGYLIIDITGKFMHEPGVLGYLHKDNIREALQKIIDLHVVSFDIEKFIQYAQVFICDVCVDLKLDSLEQVYRYIDGISSFFPISTNRFNISKYGRHGLTLKPKSKTLGFSFTIYSKGQELNYSFRKYTKATKYTIGIGVTGEALAKQTLRFEVKLYKLQSIRKWLNIPSNKKCVVRLTDVLNSREPVMLKMFELFGGKPETLLEHIEWLNDLETKTDNLTLSEIFIAERFVEILKNNCFDIEIAKNHIKTEYINVGTSELEYFNKLANLRRNLLNFLVYRKPKSITIMLAILAMLQDYYKRGRENIHAK